MEEDLHVEGGQVVVADVQDVQVVELRERQRRTRHLVVVQNHRLDVVVLLLGLEEVEEAVLHFGQREVAAVIVDGVQIGVR